MPYAYPALVLSECDIKHPMQAIFDSPVAPRSIGQRLGRSNAFGADVERALNSIPTPQAGQAFSKKQGAMPGRLASPLRTAKFALKSEWQRRNDRNSIGANSQ